MNKTKTTKPNQKSLAAWVSRRVNRLRSSILKRLTKKAFYGDFKADGLSVVGKNLSWLEEPLFAKAWKRSKQANMAGWNNRVPDIRWRSHVACWAASHAMNIEGDFVECGVHTGLLSLTILHYLEDGFDDRTFWLFDTFEGIPVHTVSKSEMAQVKRLNEKLYFDCYEIAKDNFKDFDSATLVKGIIPDSLAGVKIDKVAFLSIDLNNAQAESSAIEYFWDKLSPSAMVLLDDYAFAGHESQKQAIDSFATEKDIPVLTLPTGQGLIVKPV